MGIRPDLESISEILLEPTSTEQQLRQALDLFIQISSAVGGILPDPSFDAWAGDSFLAGGVAIAPQAAAHCARDYRRTIVFIRGVQAAIEQAKQRFPGETLYILYAGCGPYATLLLPLLPHYRPGELNTCLLDIHQDSLDSVQGLLQHFGLRNYIINTKQGDACTYQHPHPLHLVICETMQKSLEQEPQVTVTAQLEPQLHDGGILIPQSIEVRLCLARPNQTPLQATEVVSPGHTINHGDATHYEIGKLLTLTQAHVQTLLQSATYHEERDKWELPPVVIEIPALDELASFSAAFFTRIQVYGQHCLEDYDAEITLPQRCTDISPLRPGEAWEVSYQLGNYPRFNVLKKPGRK